MRFAGFRALLVAAVLAAAPGAHAKSDDTRVLEVALELTFNGEAYTLGGTVVCRQLYNWVEAPNRKIGYSPHPAFFSETLPDGSVLFFRTNRRSCTSDRPGRRPYIPVVEWADSIPGGDRAKVFLSHEVLEREIEGLRVLSYSETITQPTASKRTRRRLMRDMPDKARFGDALTLASHYAPAIVPLRETDRFWQKYPRPSCDGPRYVPVARDAAHGIEFAIEQGMVAEGELPDGFAARPLPDFTQVAPLRESDGVWVVDETARGTARFERVWPERLRVRFEDGSTLDPVRFTTYFDCLSGGLFTVALPHTVDNPTN